MIIDLTSEFERVTPVRASDHGYLQVWIEQYQRERRKYDNNYNKLDYTVVDKVLDHVFIGGEAVATDNEWLLDNNVRHVIGLASEVNYNDHELITFTRVDTFDGHVAPDNVYLTIAKLINDRVEAKQTVLVHCLAGVSRSVTAVVTYLMLYHGMSFTDALNKIRESRSIASPHPSLVWSLIRDLRGKFIP